MTSGFTDPVAIPILGKPVSALGLDDRQTFRKRFKRTENFLACILGRNHIKEHDHKNLKKYVGIMCPGKVGHRWPRCITTNLKWCRD